MPSDTLTAADTDTLPEGGGEMGALIRAFDWSKTSAGPLADWPQSLKSITGFLLLSPVPIVLLWGEDGVMIYNDAYSEFAGQRHPELLGSKVREGWPEVADFNDNIMKVGLAGGTLQYREHELSLRRRGALEPAWMNLDYSPVPGDDGRPAGVIAIVVEITEKVLAERSLRESERHLQLVVNELNHRVKNNLAMTQAIAMQTFRDAPDIAEAQERFSARMVALAQANDLLTGERWVGASLRGALEQSILPHCSAATHCRLDGPDLQITPKSALSMTLAMHELVTNAVKYGAWSRPGGTVILTWGVRGGDRLHIEWRESGGPTVSPPTRRGFGSRLIERGLAGELGGTAELRFEPDGVVCVIDAPLSVYDDE